MGTANGLPEHTGALKPPATRSPVVALRLLLLILSAGAVVAALVMTAPDRAPDPASARYGCPMHPAVRSAQPGECPICRMALEPTTGHLAGAATGRRETEPRADVAAVENVRRHNVISFVRRRSLLLSEREMRAPGWVDLDGTVVAVFYRDQADALRADEHGTFVLGQAPKRVVGVHRTTEPAGEWDRSTVRLRFAPDTATGAGADHSLEAGQVGWIELAPRPRQVLTVPASAIVQSAAGPYVLVAAGGYRFEQRPIVIGETFLKQGFAVVLSGLQVNERVAARATFFLDAERRLDEQATASKRIVP